MKKIIIILILFLNSIAYAQELIPFAEWVLERPNWKDDVSEIRYVGGRCSALYAMVGGYFIENPGKKSDVKIGEDIVKKAAPFGLVSFAISMKTGMSEDKYLAGYKLLLDVYVKKLLKINVCIMIYLIV